ncbi:Z1 domain-containing protein, partial [Variovorax sp. OV084]|uniref:Z1 domain-containing protein n=1 Tax=Variovorax sp. OV084 TaxID=1882777 RepID=UPI0008CDA264
RLKKQQGRLNTRVKSKAAQPSLVGQITAGANTYSSRGLVMGYVQSGKTANFTGVVARAADAGYRLIIVLAGTWNILRNQTQRRFDKELIGKEMLANDETYMENPPPDWDEFLEHGFMPVEQGHYGWQRLTRPNIDFKRLKAAIDSLEFDRPVKTQPIYHPDNLHAMPVKLLVVKKNSLVLTNLVGDLKKLQARLSDIPALIIDDESDQAGINVIAANAGVTTRRTPTNQRIVDLLGLLPRAQYVGYTATPYANALVDPDDDNIFPKDFIVSLDRPSGYMGVSDFFDPESVYSDLDHEDFSLPEIAHIRRVESPADADDEDLKKALRSYVLAGAVKLFRHSKDPARYPARGIRHHTMLIHTSHSKGKHAVLAHRVDALWTHCAFSSAKGLGELRTLWEEDYARVIKAQAKELVPNDFKELKDFLSATIERVERGRNIHIVVNSDNAAAPDFSETAVWKVMIGGNKLSRGYTVEGLTVSYYRRVTNTSDTLMQMGRWFGFRAGHQDLVRVYLGVKEGKRGQTDLVADFKEVCRLEERFRAEIKRYARMPGQKRITPRDIPPLVSVTGNLPPTAANKMHHARLVSKNFGGQRSMPTQLCSKPAGVKANQHSLSTLLGAGTILDRQELGGACNNGKTIRADAWLAEIPNNALIDFLEAYRWLESEYEYPQRPADITLQIEFLQQQAHGIVSWLVFAPQRIKSFGRPLAVQGAAKLAVKERARIEGRGFQVIGEPAHRVVAGYLAGQSPREVELTSPNAATTALLDTQRGVILLYPVREAEKADVSVGFELVYPENRLDNGLSFSVG